MVGSGGGFRCRAAAIPSFPEFHLAASVSLSVQTAGGCVAIAPASDPSAGITKGVPQPSTRIR